MGHRAAAGEGQEDPSKDQEVQDQACTDEAPLPGGERRAHAESSNFRMSLSCLKQHHVTLTATHGFEKQN